MDVYTDIMPYEPYLRAGFFFLILMLVWFSEIFFPRRKPMVSKKIRWLNNLIIHAINSLALRLIFPILPIGVAVVCTEEGWGLLNHYSTHPWVSILIGITILDLVIYLQHVMFHKIPVFWRLHMMHHTDLDIDVTTGVRFHPFETILSILIKIAVIFIVGPPAISVLVFEVLLNGMSMFNHGNIHIPEGIDRFLRLIAVTPDMHRVHHSIIMHENNSNYGFNIPWWDRLFGTYLAQPASGHEGMTIGLVGFRDMKYSTLLGMLSTPIKVK